MATLSIAEMGGIGWVSTQTISRWHTMPQIRRTRSLATTPIGGRAKHQINYGTGSMVMEDREVLTREQANERFGVDEICDIPDPLDRGNNPNEEDPAPGSIAFDLAPGETALMPSTWPLGANISIRQHHHRSK